MTIRMLKLPHFESGGANLHLFQTRFVIGWENNRDSDVYNAPIPENNRKGRF